MISRSGTLYATLRVARNRSIIARKRLSHVDATTYVHPTSRVARDLWTGPFVYIGHDCEIAPLVTIGRYSMLAPHVAIVGADHNWDEPGVPIQFSGRPIQPRTSIGADVWLGRGAVIICGASIGDGSIVAAGAVVTKDIPAYELWAGVPARRLRSRFEDPQSDVEHHRMLIGPPIAPRFAEQRGR